MCEDDLCDGDLSDCCCCVTPFFTISTPTLTPFSVTISPTLRYESVIPVSFISITSSPTRLANVSLSVGNHPLVVFNGLIPLNLHCTQLIGNLANCGTRYRILLMVTVSVLP